MDVGVLVRRFGWRELRAAAGRPATPPTTPAAAEYGTVAPRLEAYTIPVLSGSHVRPSANLLSFVRLDWRGAAAGSDVVDVPSETVSRLERDPLVVGRPARIPIVPGFESRHQLDVRAFERGRDQLNAVVLEPEARETPVPADVAPADAARSRVDSDHRARGSCRSFPESVRTAAGEK